MFVWDKGSGDEKIDRLDSQCSREQIRRRRWDGRREFSDHTYYLTVKTIFADTILLSLCLEKNKNKTPKRDNETYFQYEHGNTSECVFFFLRFE